MTGGLYKDRIFILRSIPYLRVLAITTSSFQISEINPYLDNFLVLLLIAESPLIVIVFVARVQPDIHGTYNLTYYPFSANFYTYNKNHLQIFD